MSGAFSPVAPVLLLESSLVVVLLALAAAAVLQATPQRRAAIRYAVSYGALVAALVLPAVDLALSIRTRSVGGGDVDEGGPARIESKDIHWKGRWLGTSHRAAATAEAPPDALVASDARGLRWLGPLWLAGAAIVFSWYGGGWLRVRALLRRSRPADPALRSHVAEMSRRLGSTRPVRLVESSEARVPMVAGLRTPTIVLPAGVLESLGPACVDSLLVHELAHVRRRDALANVVPTLAEALFFFHPGVWWLSRTVRREREHCCDDLAVGLVGDELVYARSLLRLEETRGLWPPRALSATGGAFALRIERLCRPARPGRVRRVAAALAALVAVVVLSAAMSRPHGALPAEIVSTLVPATVDLDAGLVAHYRFDGDARDASGHGHDGVVEGAIPTTDRFGRPRAAYDFDGVRSRVLTPARTPESGGSLSVGCWVLPRSHGPYRSWVAKAGFGGRASQWRVGLGPAASEWGFTEFTRVSRGEAWQDYWVTNAALPLGAWSHVAAVLDAPRHEVTLYRNGARLATFPGVEPQTPSEGGLLIGFQTDDQAWFQGKIDDVRLYARALSAAEVRALGRARP